MRQHVLKTRRTDGFTLLELLVAMTVTSLLATSILFGWRIAAGSWGRVSDLVDDQRRSIAAHQVIEQQIADMVPLTPWQRRGNPAVFFQGESQIARFVSRYSLLHRGRSGLYLIEYQIVDSEDGAKELRAEETPLRNIDELAGLLVDVEAVADGSRLRFAPLAQTERSRVLLRGLEECRFEYFSGATAARAAAWLSEWISTANELPRAMAVRVKQGGGPNRLQPVSVVAEIRQYARSLQQ